MKILITGAAGFIGMHTALELIKQGNSVVGLDNLNDYYPRQLKLDRLAKLKNYPNFTFFEMDVADRHLMSELFQSESFDTVIHLAAQAGVRYSIANPNAYIDSNIVGFMNILEGCRNCKVQHLVYASSSSVYGGNTKLPFNEDDAVNHPVSIYAATKKSNELMAHSYSHLFGIPTTGLRFFTVYGPWGRPDMALFLFTKAIINREKIDVFNHGHMKRDFTYIDDVVNGILCALEAPPATNPMFNYENPLPSSSRAPYRILNVGNQNPVALTDFIAAVEQALGIQAIKNYLPLQDGDVVNTFADTSKLYELSKNRPSTKVEEGVKRFVEWYTKYYKTPGTLLEGKR
jgi:UDP-glucuronate 4-epimerase